MEAKAGRGFLRSDCRPPTLLERLRKGKAVDLVSRRYLPADPGRLILVPLQAIRRPTEVRRVERRAYRLVEVETDDVGLQAGRPRRGEEPHTFPLDGPAHREMHIVEMRNLLRCRGATGREIGRQVVGLQVLVRERARGADLEDVGAVLRNHVER